MFYVYEWFIIETGEIIYVGKGCNRRYKVTKHNKFFNDMIKRYKCESRIIKTFDIEKEAFDYEFQRILELKNIGQCVCNIYNGGFGGTTNWWTDELQEKYSKNNIMKTNKYRERMKINNPMSNPDIAEKTNGKKRRKVIIDTHQGIGETIFFEVVIHFGQNLVVTCVEPLHGHLGGVRLRCVFVDIPATDQAESVPDLVAEVTSLLAECHVEQDVVASWS